MCEANGFTLGIQSQGSCYECNQDEDMPVSLDNYEFNFTNGVMADRCIPE